MVLAVLAVAAAGWFAQLPVVAAALAAAVVALVQPGEAGAEARSAHGPLLAAAPAAVAALAPVAVLVCWHVPAAVPAAALGAAGASVVCAAEGALLYGHHGCYAGAAGALHLQHALLVLPVLHVQAFCQHPRPCLYLGVSGPQDLGSNPHTSSSAPAAVECTTCPSTAPPAGTNTTAASFHVPLYWHRLAACKQ